MSAADWASPVLSFAGAGLGAWLVYRVGRQQEWARRFQGALDMLASDDARQRALGRARIVEICRQDSAGAGGRNEALAILREDVRASCPESLRQALQAQAASDPKKIWLAEDGDNRVEADGVFVTRSLVESATAYVEVAGGADAASDQLVVLIAQASPFSSPRSVRPDEDRAEGSPAFRTLPVDQRLILVKLSPDASMLGADALRERARKAWRLSISRVRSEPPIAVAAVAEQRVIGAWRYEGVDLSEEYPDRVEFTLGEGMSDLVGCEYRDTGQNPVRYWP